MKYVYLDQNKWIDLDIGWRRGEGEMYELASNIKKKIDNGELSIVLSSENVRETRKRSNEKRRDRLLNFMIEFSQGIVISPFRDWVIEMEILNVFFKKLGKRNLDIKSMVIGKGLPLLIGTKPSLKDDVPEEKRKEIIAKINSVETMKLILFSKGSILENAIPETERFEIVRQKERTIKDKKLQYRVVMARYFEDFIFPKMGIIHSKMNLPNDFLIKEDMDKEEDWINLFQQLPATYSYFSLIDLRDRDLSKKIEDNDFYDLFAFAMGASYCDISFGEKRFVALSKQSKLDKLYGTIITSSLKEFKKAIY